MSGNIGKPERVTQNRVVKLFTEQLGYEYLGDWGHRENNSNIEEELLVSYLKDCGYTDAHISKAVYKLKSAANKHSSSLYDNNHAVYQLLRYGVQVKVEGSKYTDDVNFINWDKPGKNKFYIAEEVTLKDGNQDRRPDIVLYVNGIAVAVIELKRSTVSLEDGIHQNLSNQQPEFNEWFFSTVQMIFAGNDSAGLRYGTILTPAKYYLNWKEDEQDNKLYKLDKYLLKMCSQERLIDIMKDFVLFDGGIKKVPRVHQYFGIKEAQKYVDKYQGGIIWHTQGSGKSIVMVLLAKWILENNPNARVVIVTDRDELDKQINGVFTDAGEEIYQTTSGRDLLTQLGQAKPRLLCSLVHKFGKKGKKNNKAFDKYIKELEAEKNKTVGEIFVFVDECHRTQSGRLHRVMKAILGNAVFIGFTGTPLMKKDKQTSMEVFGGYIHTYKFNEAVEDEVVLDLLYEARDIDQELTSEDKIDEWFEVKTKGLNEWQKDALRERWGTMQTVLSSRSRMKKVVSDIVFDFAVKPRLSEERGNAMLVASSIFEACKYYDLFQNTVFKGKCAVVTSYDPQAKDVSLEEVGANSKTDKQYIYNIYKELLKDVDARPGKSKTETYEDDVKELFKTQPANMKLLIVVDKLLTGFDAPSCTFLYIDKSMKDHGLFQAICRVNRLDTPDKEFGYIVDYKDLFKKVDKAIKVYTSELDHSNDDPVDPNILMKNRLEKGRERLENALEAIALICEPVKPPKDELCHIHYFCGNTEIESDLKEREPQRVALYKATAALVRTFANLSDDMEAAGYSDSDVKFIEQEIDKYLKLREVIRQASNEIIDLKAYEADMRHLIDTYIKADEPRKISPFDDMPLLEIIIKTGIADAIDTLSDDIKHNQEAVAEVIENNVRSKIIKDHLNNPEFYSRMSHQLDELIKLRKQKAIEYEEYLKRIAEIASQVGAGQGDDTPEKLNTKGKRALYDNLDQNEELALKIDATVIEVCHDDWRDNPTKESYIKGAIFAVLGDKAEAERIFQIIYSNHEDY